ncbi:MAG: T9SS type A sorting domain-containing protein [Ignavibacteria bacterium]|nr:T9SS type A sorting domain-containing protein [Ignavibacteria bacterium]
MKTIYGLIFFTAVINYAQIDTSVYYPLHIGDKWEYYTPGDGYSIVEILGDTLMPNGYKYFIFSLVNRKYQRLDSNYFVKIYNENFENQEYTWYDFYSPKGTIIFPWQANLYGYGIYDIGIDANNLLNQNLEWREFREVYVDTTVIPHDTLWVNLVDLYWPRITKGIGVTSYAYGFQVLEGVYINGVGYGSLVNVREAGVESPCDFTLYQNYPNPFNSRTKINFNLFKSAFVSVKVYNMLGQETAVLDYGYRQAGNHSVSFEATNLPSGTYLINLSTDGQTKTIKAILLK